MASAAVSQPLSQKHQAHFKPSKMQAALQSVAEQGAPTSASSGGRPRTDSLEKARARTDSIAINGRNRSESISVAKKSMAGLVRNKMLMRRFSKASLLSEAKERSSSPKVLYENTYKTEPDEGTRFSVYQVEKIVKEVLEQHLRGVEYDPKRSAELSKRICTSIKSKVKDLNFARYKLVVNLIFAQAYDQGVEVASRCIWQPTTDNFACVPFKNKSLIAIAFVHGIYYE